MREHYGLDWSSGVIGALEHAVRQRYPQRLRVWPTLQTFDWDLFQLSEHYFALVFRDKLSGIPSGPGSLCPFPYSDHPPLPPTLENVGDWLDYLSSKFNLRSEDFAMVLPIHDAGKHGANHDFELFTQSEQQLFYLQLERAIDRQRRSLNMSEDGKTQIIYNLSGPNARFNINSVDSSVNV